MIRDLLRSLSDLLCGFTCAQYIVCNIEQYIVDNCQQLFTNIVVCKRFANILLTRIDVIVHNY